MPARPCLICGALFTPPPGARPPPSRYPAHEGRGDGRRASTSQRGYGAAHQRLRARLLPLAYGRPCPRCGRPMLRGQAVDLGHTDDRSGYQGMEHRLCNRAKR